MNRETIFIIFIFFLISTKVLAQTDTIFNPNIEYKNPKTYQIVDVQVEGVKHLNKDILIQISRLNVGNTIEVPGNEISNAIKRLYKQGLFSVIKVRVKKIYKDKIFLVLELKERPKLSAINIEGVSKQEKEKLLKQIAVQPGTQVTSNLTKTIDRIIKNYFKEKGYNRTHVIVNQEDDPDVENGIYIDVKISKNKKIKIKNIFIDGNKEVKKRRLKKSMKKTNELSIRNFFRSKKYIEKEFKADKIKLIEKYNELGYRDAIILSDSVSQVTDNRVDIYLHVSEGNRYYFNNVNWVGNTIYPAEILNRYFKIKKGDPYNKKLLDKRLTIDEDAVHSLYTDYGYLFSNITPYETVQGTDSINLEIRIYEGQQATINRVLIRGNEKTNEHVIRRELYTYPGELFSKNKIIRSIRELANLGHFDPEKIMPDVQPNLDNNTVDIIYNVEEKSNDQIELSGGYGAGTFLGSLGLKFSNFSVRNLLNMKSWKPLPVGDGQTLAFRGQTNASYYNSFSISFVEPWLGGKRPNAFSISFSTSKQTRISSNYSIRDVDPERNQRFNIIQFSLGLGRRLNWPDNYFTLSNHLSFSRYKLDNWPGFLSITDGNSNIFTFSTVFARNSIDNPIYTRRGSLFSLGLELTPPYSIFEQIDYTTATSDEKHKWIEYHKWNFKAKLFTPLNAQRKLVLYTGMEYGFLGYYNKDKRSPFEGFSMGGDGITGSRYYGSDIIGLRGYENNSVTPRQGIANIYSKMTTELRYPVSLSRSATIYVLGFVEGGNSWFDFHDFEPFNFKRSAGVGIRIFLPIFGMLGIDWAYGFDEIIGFPNASGAQFHFTFGQQF